MKRFLLAAAALLVIAPEGAMAQAGPGGLQPDDDTPVSRQGTRGANFLNLAIGARGTALAGAVVGSEEGVTAWYWNPSGMATTETFTAGFSRQNLYDDLDISLNYMGIGLPVFGGVLGAHATSLNSGDLMRTDEANPDGGNAAFGQTFDWKSTSIGIGYARRLTDRLNVGASIKYVNEGVNNASITWGALDAGTTFRTGLYGLTIGAAIANVGPASRMKGALTERIINTDQVSPQVTTFGYDMRDTDLPTMFRFSVASDILGSAESLFGTRLGTMHRLTGEAAFSDAIESNLQSAYALEYSFANRLFLRGGKRFFNDDRATGSSGSYGLSGGLGFRLPVGQSHALRFDYAYTSLGDLQNVQVFTFELGR